MYLFLAHFFCISLALFVCSMLFVMNFGEFGKCIVTSNVNKPMPFWAIFKRIKMAEFNNLMQWTTFNTLKLFQILSNPKENRVYHHLNTALIANRFFSNITYATPNIKHKLFVMNVMSCVLVILIYVTSLPKWYGIILFKSWVIMFFTRKECSLENVSFSK